MCVCLNVLECLKFLVRPHTSVVWWRVSSADVNVCETCEFLKFLVRPHTFVVSSVQCRCVSIYFLDWLKNPVKPYTSVVTIVDLQNFAFLNNVYTSMKRN